MPDQKSYTLDEIQHLLANLDNLALPETNPANKKMKRVKLPIPPEYGGGVVTGYGYEDTVRRLLDRVRSTLTAPSEAPSFRECWEAWINIKEGQDKSPSTIENYKGISKVHLLPFFGEKPLDRINADDIQMYFNSIMQLSSSISTQSKAILSGIFDRAVRLGNIQKNPMQYKYERSRKHGSKVVLQDDDLIDVITGLENILQTGDVRDYLYFCFLCFTALRRGEILGLRWKDIDFEKEEISVRNNVTFPNGDNNPVICEPKDGSIGVVRLHSGLANRIRKYKSKPNDYVIPYGDDEHTRPITRSMFTKLWNRCKKYIDTKGASSHSFRASYATMMNAHCDHMDPKTLQRALRHKTPDLALKVYTKPNDAKLKTAEAEYDAYLCSALAQKTDQAKTG